MAIGDFALMTGLTPDEQAFVKPYLDRQLFPARAALYHEGQLGDRLYLLAKGAVTIVAGDLDAKGKHRVSVTLAQGVIFGESAMIEGGTRSHTAVAEGEVVTYSLSRAQPRCDLRAQSGPVPAHRAQHGLAHVGTLRMTTTILRDASEAVD
jgi:CRP-like cAMP-binding protein